jgi:enamine deaminase RidA (YjgF/YER057c/UK114 family)
MKKQRIVCDAVPEPAPGSFTNAFRVGDTIYVSGQHAGRPDGTIAGAGDVQAQATAAFEKIAALLAAGGATMDDVVKLTVYLTDIAGRPGFAAARRAFFSGDFPCSTLVAISALAQPGLLVEIEAIAVAS